MSYQFQKVHPQYCGIRAALILVSVLALVFGLAGPSLAGADKILVCHRPPGNPSNFKIKSVSVNALPAHLALGDNVYGPEVCDGIDNDCDGEVDNDLTDTGDSCSAGVGACEVDGNVICDEDGILMCDAIPGTPDDEMCDGIDNNCDGMIDENGSVLCDDGNECTSSTCEAEMCTDPEAIPEFCPEGNMCDLTLGCVPEIEPNGEDACPCDPQLLGDHPQPQDWSVLTTTCEVGVYRVEGQALCIIVVLPQNHLFELTGNGVFGCRFSTDSGEDDTSVDNLTPTQVNACVALFPVPGDALPCIMGEG